MIETPEIRQWQRQRTAVIQLTVPRAEIRQVMGPAIQEVAAAVAGQGLRTTGPLFSYHYKMSPEVFDFAVGFPTNEAVTASGRVSASELPERKVAYTVYRGPYEGLGAAWGELDQWLRDNGHRPAEDLWECYATGPETSRDPGNWQTELYRPLAE